MMCILWSDANVIWHGYAIQIVSSWLRRKGLCCVSKTIKQGKEYSKKTFFQNTSSLLSVLKAFRSVLQYFLINYCRHVTSYHITCFNDWYNFIYLVFVPLFVQHVTFFRDRRLVVNFLPFLNNIFKHYYFMKCVFLDNIA